MMMRILIICLYHQPHRVVQDDSMTQSPQIQLVEGKPNSPSATDALPTTDVFIDLYELSSDEENESVS